MVATDSPSSSDPRFLTKIEIKCMIRRLMSPRIIRYIYSLGKNTKKSCVQKLLSGRYVSAAQILPFLLFLSTSSTSRSLFEWEDSDNEEPEGDEEPERETRAVLYARVSNPSQVKEGHSLDTQIDNLRDFAEKNNIHVVDELQDKGKTGTDFTRAGIRKAFEMASNGQIDEILVDDITRIGRNAPQTIYFIYILEEEIGVQIQTPERYISLSEIRDLIITTMEALMGHIETKEQGRKSKDSSVRLFLKEKKWTSWYQIPPLGYEMDGNNWISINDRTEAVVKEIFTQFLKSESYAETKRRVDDQFEDQFESGIAYNTVRKILADPVYVGKPSIPINPENYTVDENHVYCPDLQIVGDSTFEAVQAVREQIKKKSSSNTNPISVEDIVDEFGLFPAAMATPKLKPHCQACNSPMRKNGTKVLETSKSSVLRDNMRVQNFECASEHCDKQYKFPSLRDYDWMSYLREGVKSYFPDFESK